MPKTDNLNIRIEPEIKKNAEKTLDCLGLTMAEAVKLFLKQVIMTESIPFEIKIPKYNKQTMLAVEEAEEMYNNNTGKVYNNFDEVLEELTQDVKD